MPTRDHRVDALVEGDIALESVTADRDGRFFEFLLIYPCTVRIFGCDSDVHQVMPRKQKKRKDRLLRFSSTDTGPP
jgi:hypothetical protein